ncbi:MAG: CapA family protein [Tissierellia bacterium]|nr:CapA family protein [Tissierellia bacterium]
MKRQKYLILFLLLFLTACNKNSLTTIDGKEKAASHGSKEQVEKVVEEITLIATGDLIFHQPIVKSYFNGETYDFTPCFRPIERELQEADIALANFEGSIDSKRPTSGFPRFNFPKESIHSLKRVGFDVLSTANNHALDMGIEGIDETLETMKKEGIVSVGTFQNHQRPPAVMEVRGVRVGFLAYTQSLNGLDSLLPPEEEYRINRFSEEIIKSDIESLKSHTDFVVILPHWGHEYIEKSNPVQQEWNKKFYDYGADMVLGSHPHVLQETDRSIGDWGDHFTIYSMGNALSNQRVDHLRKKGVETGILVKAIIEKNFTTNTTRLKDISLEPTYVNRYRSEGKFRYEVVKLRDFLEGGAFYEGIDPLLREKAKKYFQEAEEILYRNENSSEKAA